MQSGMHAGLRPRDKVIEERDQTQGELDRYEKTIEDCEQRRQESRHSASARRSARGRRQRGVTPLRLRCCGGQLRQTFGKRS